MPDVRYVRSVELMGTEKRYLPARHYVFIMRVTWSDNSEFVIYRKYSEFFQFHARLVEMFPIENGFISEFERIIPALPSRMLLKRTEVKKVAEERKESLGDYCQELVQLEPRISRTEHVLDFFTANVKDIHPPKNACKKPERFKNVDLLSPLKSCARRSQEKKEYRRRRNVAADSEMSISGPMHVETYTAVANYRAKMKTEVSFTAGELVDVLEKSENGWWFVRVEEQQGWAPASYLDAADGEESEEPPPDYSGSERFLTIQEYSSQFNDEVPFAKGVVVDVIHKLLDGWWIINYNGKIGYAPAQYLQPYANPHLSSGPLTETSHEEVKNTIASTKPEEMAPLAPRRRSIKNMSRKYSKRKEKDLSHYRRMSTKKRRNVDGPNGLQPQISRIPSVKTDVKEEASEDDTTTKTEFVEGHSEIKATVVLADTTTKADVPDALALALARLDTLSEDEEEVEYANVSSLPKDEVAKPSPIVERVEPETGLSVTNETDHIKVKPDSLSEAPTTELNMSEEFDNALARLSTVNEDQIEVKSLNINDQITTATQPTVSEVVQEESIIQQSNEDNLLKNNAVETVTMTYTISVEESALKESSAESAQLMPVDKGIETQSLDEDTNKSNVNIITITSTLNSEEKSALADSEENVASMIPTLSGQDESALRDGKDNVDLMAPTLIDEVDSALRDSNEDAVLVITTTLHDEESALEDTKENAVVTISTLSSEGEQSLEPTLNLGENSSLREEIEVSMITVSSKEIDSDSTVDTIAIIPASEEKDDLALKDVVNEESAVPIMPSSSVDDKVSNGNTLDDAILVITTEQDELPSKSNAIDLVPVGSTEIAYESIKKSDAEQVMNSGSKQDNHITKTQNELHYAILEDIPAHKETQMPLTTSSDRGSPAGKVVYATIIKEENSYQSEDVELENQEFEDDIYVNHDDAIKAFEEATSDNLDENSNSLSKGDIGDGTLATLHLGQESQGDLHLDQIPAMEDIPEQEHGEVHLSANGLFTDVPVAKITVSVDEECAFINDSILSTVVNDSSKSSASLQSSSPGMKRSPSPRRPIPSPRSSPRPNTSNTNENQMVQSAHFSYNELHINAQGSSNDNSEGDASRETQTRLSPLCPPEVLPEVQQKQYNTAPPPPRIPKPRKTSATQSTDGTSEVTRISPVSSPSMNMSGIEVSLRVSPRNSPQLETSNSLGEQKNVAPPPPRSPRLQRAKAVNRPIGELTLTADEKILVNTDLKRRPTSPYLKRHSLAAQGVEAPPTVPPTDHMPKRNSLPYTSSVVSFTKAGKSQSSSKLFSNGKKSKDKDIWSSMPRPRVGSFSSQASIDSDKRDSLESNSTLSDVFIIPEYDEEVAYESLEDINENIVRPIPINACPASIGESGFTKQESYSIHSGSSSAFQPIALQDASGENYTLDDNGYTLSATLKTSTDELNLPTGTIIQGVVTDESTDADDEPIYLVPPPARSWDQSTDSNRDVNAVSHIPPIPPKSKRYSVTSETSLEYTTHVVSEMDKGLGEDDNSPVFAQLKMQNTERKSLMKLQTMPTITSPRMNSIPKLKQTSPELIISGKKEFSEDNLLREQGLSGQLVEGEHGSVSDA